MTCATTRGGRRAWEKQGADGVGWVAGRVGGILHGQHQLRRHRGDGREGAGLVAAKLHHRHPARHGTHVYAERERDERRGGGEDSLLVGYTSKLSGCTKLKGERRGRRSKAIESMRERGEGERCAEAGSGGDIPPPRRLSPSPHKSHRNEKTQAPWTHWNSTVAANSSPTRRVLFMTR